MKKTLPTLLLGCLLMGACSKSGTERELSAERASSRNSTRTATTLLEPPPAPMPADTLEIDSLDRPGFY